MMDLSPTYLCLGGEPPPISNPFAHWVQKKELPLVGQLSLTRQADNVYPFLLLHGFSLLKAPSPPSDDQMNPHAAAAADDDDDDDADDTAAHELPLLWQQNPKLSRGSLPNAMDAFVWSHLPHDLIEKIVAFLHVPQAARLSVVSKQWNSLPYSPKFLKSFTESHLGGSPTLMFQFDSMKNKLQEAPWLALYDILQNRWYSMDLGFLPAPPLVPFTNYTVVAASGGLLCLWPEPQKTLKTVGFIVCNPVTRSWKELPCRSQDNRLPDLVAMHASPTTSCYKILVLMENASGSQVEVYDSKTGRWKLTFCDQSFEGRFKSTVVSGGKVFFVCAERRWFQIKVFDMDEQQWRSSISIPTFFYETQEDFKAPEVLDCNGRLFLVGRVGKHSCKEDVILWELDSGVNGVIDTWREVDRMPQDIAREFLGCLVFGHYHCISRGDQIFFIASFKAPMLTYDVVKKAWSWWAWPFYEKYADRFPIFGFVKAPPAFPPFGFAFDLRFGVLE